ncbi:MAG: hypothetical protein ACQER9_03900 [Nanobdellota archaeon]
MKLKILILTAIVLISSFAFAAENGKDINDVKGNGNIDKIINEKKSNLTKEILDKKSDMIKGFDNNSKKFDSNKSVDDSLGKIISKNNFNRSKIREKVNEFKKEIQEKNKSFNNREKNRNKMRVAARTLAKMENFTGKVGHNISQIAREFNNSMNKTYQAEEKIRKRNNFSRFFLGGNEKSAEKIESQVEKNRKNIEKLKRLKNEVNEEIKPFMQEQIKEMEKEQERLNNLARKEKKNKGLFGWIWK